MPLETLRLGQIIKPTEVRRLPGQPQYPWFNSFMQLVLNSNFLIQNLNNPEKLRLLEEELSELKKERTKERRTQVLKTLKNPKRAGKLKIADGTILEVSTKMKECQRKIDACKSKIHFLKAFNIFIQSYGQDEEMDSRIITTIIDSLNLSNLLANGSSSSDDFLLNAFDRIKNLLGDIEMDLVKEGGSLESRVFLIDLPEDLPGKNLPSVLDNFFQLSHRLLQESPQELFLKQNRPYFQPDQISLSFVNEGTGDEKL